MNSYKDYLELLGYEESTVTCYERERLRLENWCGLNHILAAELDYKTGLKYIGFLKKGITKRTVNHRLQPVKLYFNYLIELGLRTSNPFQQTRLRGATRPLNRNVLSEEELDGLYHDYYENTFQESYHYYTFKRNKVIIGLYVYQGLTTNDLSRLVVDSLNLEMGELLVAGTGRSNSRIMRLMPCQMLELHNYLTVIRPKIQARIKNNDNKLFPINGRFSSVTFQIAKKLRKLNANFTNVKQLRASVIANWLTKHNLRKVQYLAGHRYVSSTESYLQDDLEALHEMINSCHPIS